ncbi:MAG: histidine phosphatase family protein [Burkholderiaceae bacterium]
MTGPNHLVLWRHADAGEPLDDPGADFDRALSRRGRRQAAAAAVWLDSLQLPDPVLVSSPAPRARRTALAFGVPRIDPRLAPQASLDELHDLIGSLDVEAAILVGHQPAIGQLAARLLTGASAPFVSISVPKGSAWWFVARAGGAMRLQGMHANGRPASRE